MKKILLIGCLLLAVAFLCDCKSDTPKAKLISPKQLAAKLKEEGEIEFMVAKYGKIPSGSSFNGALFLANPIDGCNWIEHFSSGEVMYDEHLAVIVKKGNCPYHVATKNAQNAGAKLVVIVNDKDELPTKVIGDVYDPKSITIPTIIVKKEDGDKIIEFIKKIPFPPLNPDSTNPRLSVNFPYEKISDTVSLDFWYSAHDVKNAAYHFINIFHSFTFEEPNVFQFTPHFVTWDCYECRFENYQIPIEGDCISGGRYCAPDPDDVGPLTGSHVLYEDLRQACMWRQDQGLYWSYIVQYPSTCLGENMKEEPDECSERLLDQPFVFGDKVKVRECIQNSFISSGSKPNAAIDDNRILKEEKQLQDEYGITEFPVLLINHKPFSGKLEDTSAVFKKICENLSPRPTTCKRMGYGGTPGWKIGVMVLIIVLLSVAAFVLFCGSRAMGKRSLGIELSNEASNMVSRYMAVSNLEGLAKEEED